MLLVFGKNGQVATALSHHLPQASFLGSDIANFLNPESVIQQLEEIKPKVIINASAYTSVDKAECEKDSSLQINATTPGIIASWCRKNDACLIHYSTDYVFQGDGHEPWTEDALPNPINWYGTTKLKGEEAILQSGCKAYIFRISWVYSPWGNNFPKTILRLAKEREQLSIVNDQWGAPTDALDVAKATANLVKSLQSKCELASPGIYHLCFEEYQTWYDFAVKVINNARSDGQKLALKSLTPISSEQFPTPAKRPKNSRLGSKYSKHLFT
ncbi:dTDP-4-dehydrorhamnose reductase [Bdellovibrio bacteriovorus]|uniref:dTDP-4-dehydrorhamnose reductase n=1 Tax=Bdellovibrio bacteriovorus TaxID=959 RepID=UPI0035A6E3E2